MPRKPRSEYPEALSPITCLDHAARGPRLRRAALLLLLLAGASASSRAQTNQPFDGRPWNISTGNLSVGYIQASPIGAFPRP